MLVIVGTQALAGEIEIMTQHTHPCMDCPEYGFNLLALEYVAAGVRMFLLRLFLTFSSFKRWSMTLKG